MAKDYDALFKKRTDELYDIEKRIEEREETLIALIETYKKEHADARHEFVKGTREAMGKLNAASKTVSDSSTKSQQYAARSVKLFVGSVLISLLIASGVLWWSNYVISDLADAREELSAITVKLQHEPVITVFKGNDYVRVVPDTETSFIDSNGDSMPGRYSQVWHMR